MTKKNLLKELNSIFWIFVIGSILGFIFETILVLFQKGYIESRSGLLYGPFTPVYGIGGIIYYIAFKFIKTKDIGKVFLITMVLGGITEYIASYVQEKLYGTISWDYSYLKINFNGRTSLLHCSYWGLAGVLYVMYIGPLIEKLKEKINTKRSLKIITGVFAIFMLFNITLSCLAADRQTERRNNVAPQNAIDTLLDNVYPDEFMDRVYSNKKVV